MSLGPEERKKLADVAHAVEARALLDVVARQKAGQRLSTADLRLLERLQRTQSQPENADEAWVSIADAAKAIGVTERGLRDWTHKTDNPLPVREIDGRACVQVRAAYDYAVSFAKRTPGLKLPALSSTQQDAPDVEASAPFEGDPYDVLRRVVGLLNSGQQLIPQQISAAVAAVRELRQKEEADARAKQRFESDEVIKLLHGVGEVWVQTTDALIGTVSKRLVTHINTQLAIDLEAKNITAAAIIEAFLRSELSQVIAQVKAEVSRAEGIVEDRAA